MFKNLLNKLAGSPYEREIRYYRQIVSAVNEQEPRLRAMSDAELRGLTEDLRERVREHVAGIEDRDELKKAEREILDEVLPEAFAAVREASRRTTGLRHYDVQLIGGIVLHEGKIAEMRTGEGKTLVASLPLYLNALAGRGAHLITVNDYLARRDGGWMGPIFHLLGMSVGVIGKEQFSAIFDPDYVDPGGGLEDERLVHWRPAMRQDCYTADVTYGTATEFGFDYLRDNTAIEVARTVQREHTFAIVDEVDSVLIDGARTPLIISGPAARASDQYNRFAEIVEKARMRRNTTDLKEGEEPDGDYELDERTQAVSLTERGIEKIERQLSEIDLAAGQSVYDPQFYELVHYLDNALKAKYTFKRDKDYIVQDGHVILIDQTTGRPMPSRRYSEGLHQAIEAKEGVTVQREDVTIATITIQNYFRLYDKLGGMTGTAMTQAEEFDEVYQLDVVAIPTNIEFMAESGEFQTIKDREEGVPVITYRRPDNPSGRPDFYRRVDYTDQVFTTINGKFQAVAEEIVELYQAGRPVLVGTGSVDASEVLSNHLKKIGLKHETLNAKNHDREALIIAQAGRPGAITISTSMAGRGTDILLGGNPEGLATRYVAERCFPMRALREVVGSVVRGELESARHRAESDPTLGAAVVDWVSREYDDLVRKASVEDIPTAVINDLRAEPLYSDIPFEKLAQLVRQIDLTTIDYRRLDHARRYAEEHGLSTSLIPEVQYRLSDYRMLGGVMGQNEQIETLTRRLYELHYNARAALVRAVLAGQEDRAREIARQLPALPEALIQDVHNIVAEHEAERRRVWELGGLHVIGTERHESRRIDDQLRGRAARQGDPGSSRFYLSLEDELMMRFGGDRTKRIMDRLNIPEDMPISANILSNIIEQAQARFESYYFDIRKNLVEYDEAVNRQRAIVYDERDAILRGDSSRLDEFVRRFIQEALERLCERYIDGYEAWAMPDVLTAVDDFSDFETGEVNTRGVVQRVMSLFPRLEPDALQELLAITTGDALTREINNLITDGIEQGHNLRILHADIARIVPLWPVAPGFSTRGVENWEAYLEEIHKVIDLYTHPLSEDDRQTIWGSLSEELDRLFRQQIASTGKGEQAATVQAAFYANLGAELNRVFLEIIDGMEQEDLIAVLLERVEHLLGIAALDPVEVHAGALATAVWQPDGQVFAIGKEELGNYQRALMLTVMDEEWRQYLNAIDDLRQGAGLAAVGQRDPKVEFKRRAFEMFEQLRLNTQEGIARRFFETLPRHRQIVESQRRQDELLDRLAQTGYRIQQRRRQGEDGQVRVSQTVTKDMWSNVGRNDPCPCGSGKKFKDCHYNQIRQQQAAATTPGGAPPPRQAPGGKRRRR